MKLIILKLALISVFVFPIGFIITINPVRAETYGVTIGDAWTIELNSEGGIYKISYQITAVSSTTILATMRVIDEGREDYYEESEVDLNQNKFLEGPIVYSMEYITNTLVSISTLKNKTYGGRVLECYETTNPITGYELLVVEKSTGISVEKREGSGFYLNLKVVNWNFEDPPGFTPLNCVIFLILLPIYLIITPLFPIIYHIRARKVRNNFYHNKSSDKFPRWLSYHPKYKFTLKKNLAIYWDIFFSVSWLVGFIGLPAYFGLFSYFPYNTRLILLLVIFLCIMVIFTIALLQEQKHIIKNIKGTMNKILKE